MTPFAGLRTLAARPRNSGGGGDAPPARRASEGTLSSATLRSDGAIAHLSLAGPLDEGLVAEIARACEAAGEDRSVHVLLLSGDSVTWAGWSEAALAHAEREGLVGDPLAPLADLAQPVVAALDGAVRGGGLELSLCADLRVAGGSATFALAGLSVGALPIAGGLQRLVRTVGRARALELALRGEPVDVETALQWGLVGAVAADPIAEARALAERVAAQGPLAIRFAKEAVRRGVELPLDQALRYETDLTVLLQTSEDRAEGVRAFLEKRPPQFHGR